MSRSNPNQDSAPNPAQRWFEWNGQNGHFRYYDKQAEKRVDLKPDFTFILLDETNSVKGWHQPSEKGIVSNAVRDTQTEPFNVRTFGGLTIATGLWTQIRDKVDAAGGRFNRDCYCAFKDGKDLKLGVVQFKGAALGAWCNFTKANRVRVDGPNDQKMAAYYANAIRVRKITKGKQGKVEFCMPVFELVPLTAATNKAATELDIELQAYLKDYFTRTQQPKAEPAEAPQPDAPGDQQDHPEESEVPDQDGGGVDPANDPDGPGF